MVVMGGLAALSGVLPAAVTLRRRLRRLAVPGVQLRRPATDRHPQLAGGHRCRWSCCCACGSRRTGSTSTERRRLTVAASSRRCGLLLAWAPYACWSSSCWSGVSASKTAEPSVTVFPAGRACTTWSNRCRRWSPRRRPTRRVYSFNWLSASGTACLFATFARGSVLRLSAQRGIRSLSPPP